MEEAATEETALLRDDSLSSTESEEEYKSRQKSIYVLYFTNFISAIGFSVIMPSVFPYLQVVCPEVQTSFLGIVIASYSLGQFVMSPVIGGLSKYLNNSGPPLIIGLSCQVIGNVLWAYLQDVPPMNGYSFVIARTLIGIGAANMAVVRAYVSKATTVKERTGVNAIVSACQSLGFCIGPGLQAAFVPLGYPGPIETPAFRLNMFTSAGWFGAITSAINIVAILFLFREHEIPDDASVRAVSVRAVNVSNGDVNEHAPDSNEEAVKPDYLVVVLLLFCFFALLCLFVMFETMSTPLTMYEYGWGKGQATFNNGIIWATTGVISIAVVLMLRGPLKRVPERLMLVIGYVMLLIGIIVYLPYGGNTPPIRWVNSSFDNATDVGGCPSTLDWCFTVPQVHLAQLLTATFFLSLGYPATTLLVYTLFSKILGPIPQGLWMGFFTASGSLARMVGPIFVGSVLEGSGPLVVLVSVGGLLFVTFVIVLVMYGRLIPYMVRLRVYQEIPSG